MTPQAALLPKDWAMSMETSSQITTLTRGISSRISHQPSRPAIFRSRVDMRYRWG